MIKAKHLNKYFSVAYATSKTEAYKQNENKLGLS
jgi:hypothetical protein